MLYLFKWVVASIAASLAAVVLIVWLAAIISNSRAKVVALAPAVSQLDALHAACIREMIASTCKVMGTAASTSPMQMAKPGELVFVAGVGAISAVDYQQMYEAGDAMCAVVKKACTEDWQSNRCKTARRLLAI